MMEKEIQRKKKVLIDLTNYGSLTAGFGQIAANYAAAFSSMPIEDLHFVYFLYEKQDRDYLCEWTRVSIPFYIFFPCTTAWRFSSDYSRNNEQLCKFPLRD